MRKGYITFSAILLLLMLTCKLEVYGVQYFVNSITGNDSNPGTNISLPWKSLAPVNSKTFKPGDIINFACGSSWKSELTITSSGTKGVPVIFKSYGKGNKPVISNPFPEKFAIKITGNWIIVDGLMARDAHMAGIELIKGSDHNIIRNCEVTNAGMGISVRGRYNLITHNYVHDLYMIRNTPQSVNKDDDYGAAAFWMWAPNNEISYNKAVNCEQPSWDYALDGGFIELYTNGDSTYIHHNWSEQCNGFIETSGSSKNVTIAYNVSLESSDIFIFLHIRVNASSVSNVQNWKVDNNTVIRKYGRSRVSLINFGNVFTPPPPGTIFLRNNIFVLGGGGETIHNVAPTGDFVHENNIYYILDKAEIGYAPGPNEKLADPLFVNMIANDFKLTKGSPAIGAGANLGYDSDFTGKKLSPGSRPNIGAY
jgi:parallel beta-helix repeat protein